MNAINRGMFWSAFGTLIPLASAFLAIPHLLAALGDARFGILTLAWVFVGYFSFFDFGLGRGLTHAVATQYSGVDDTKLTKTIHSGLVLMVALGILGGVAVALVANWAVEQISNIDQKLKSEATLSVYILAISVPLVILGNGFRGILEGLSRFELVNIVKGPLGSLSYLAPVTVLAFTTELPVVVSVLVVGRLLTLATYSYFCFDVLPGIRTQLKIHISEVSHILSFGGWITISNITGPLLLYLGRFILAALVAPEAVAYFSTSYEIVAALLLIPAIYVSVLFPIFSKKLMRKSNGECARLYYRWQLITFLTVTPFCAVIYFFSEQGLALWITKEFAEKSYQCAQILSLGVFINSFGHISQSLIQAYGRPDLTAKLHIFELIIYIPYIWWLITHYGVVGAAVAWTVRVTLSTITLSAMAQLCLTGTIRAYKSKKLAYENR